MEAHLTDFTPDHSHHGRGNAAETHGPGHFIAANQPSTWESRRSRSVEWFQRQIFGNKRERFAPTPDPMQMHVGEVSPVPESVPEERQVVPAHTRRVAKTGLANKEESVPFFDELRVPVETFMVIDAEIKALEQYAA